MSNAKTEKFTEADDVYEVPVEQDEGGAVDDIPLPEEDGISTFTSMPEAVAVVFTDMLTGNGDRINITCRGMSGKKALDELASTITYARDRYNFRMPSATKAEVAAASTAPAIPLEPRYVPDEQTHPAQASQNFIPTPAATAVPANVSLTDIHVNSIARERKRDGTGDFLRVRGGLYTKYGVPAYDNVFPAGFNIDGLQYGLEYPPPQGMTTVRVQANVDAAGKTSKAKVVQFY